ncbi:MAG: enoyl-CoA hydratase/isomerase family protein [Rhizobiales bacterium]|nr:enoyl-CoA hydratase/isomerase family protein [Hyphomicrobiales bacterium]
MSSFVSVARQGDVAVITIDNPPVNALSFHVREPLMQALVSLRDDPSVAAIGIACAGRTFVAGADITEFGKPMQQPELRAIVAVLEAIAKPTVAAIHGTALGGGLELALGCHFRVADAGAKVGLPEVKLGLLPGFAIVRLHNIVGRAKAKELSILGDPISAAEAERIGLVLRVVPHDTLMANAMEFAERIAAKPRLAVAMAKSFYNSGLGGDEMRHAVDGFPLLMMHEDAREGVSAFLEKRKPKFKD